MDEESQAGCDYFKEKLEINEKFVAENVKKHAGSDYWRMVEMFYLQMDGITQGFLQKSQEENLPYEDFDVKHGVRQINFLVDYFDYLAKYHEKKQKQTKPSCSVLIKHLAEEGDLFVGHNTWHLYSAMGYRYRFRGNLCIFVGTLQNI